MFHVDIFIREISQQCTALCPFKHNFYPTVIILAVIDVEIKNITFARNNKDYSHFRFRELNKPKETEVSGSILNNISAFPAKLYNRYRNTTAILLADNYTPSKEPTVFCTLYCVVDVEFQASRTSCNVSFLQTFLEYSKTVGFLKVCFLSWNYIDMSGFFGD